MRDEPIIARPPSTAYQLRKFARRHRALVGGVIATFLVLVAGIIVSTSYYLEAEDKRARKLLAAGVRPALVVSDVVLPGEYDGFGVAEEVRRRSPETAVLLISGYAGAELDDARVGRVAILAKPFTSKQLRSAVEQALAERKSLEPQRRARHER